MDVKSCRRYRVRKESLCLKVKLLLGFASGDFHPSQCHSCSRRAAGGLIQCRVSSLLYAELFLTPAFRCGLAASAVQGWSPPGAAGARIPSWPALPCAAGRAPCVARGHAHALARHEDAGFAFYSFSYPATPFLLPSNHYKTGTNECVTLNHETT